MPITVQHQPDPVLLGGYAERAAAGQAQRENLIRSLDRQDRMWLAGQQIALSREQAAQRAALASEEMDLRRQLAGQADFARQQELLLRLGDSEAGRRLQQQLAEQSQQAAQQRDMDLFASRGVDAMEMQVREIQKQFASRNLTPQGRRDLADLMGKLRAIQSQRADMPPGEYGRLMGNWLGEFERSGIETQTIDDPDPAAELAKRAVPMPDGSRFVLQPSGQFQHFPAAKTEQPEALALQALKIEQSQMALKMEEMRIRGAWLDMRNKLFSAMDPVTGSPLYSREQIDQILGALPPGVDAQPIEQTEIAGELTGLPQQMPQQQIPQPPMPPPGQQQPGQEQPDAAAGLLAAVEFIEKTMAQYPDPTTMPPDVKLKFTQAYRIVRESQ